MTIERPADPLSQLLRLLEPTGLSWKVGERTGAWEMRYPATDGIVFCVVLSGEARVSTADAAGHDLAAGDVLLLVGPSAWSLRALPLAAREVRVVGGHFKLGIANADLLRRLLPGRILVRATDAGGGRMRTLVGLLGSEAQAALPGRLLVLERLLEILVIEATRHDAGSVRDENPGLLPGLADPRLAAALHALHGDPARRWTIEGLALIAGISRSAFARRFALTLGQPPLAYLLQWRMALAKRALRDPGANLAAIAAASGYASTGAFSTAFSRTVGVSPSAYSPNGGRRAAPAR